MAPITDTSHNHSAAYVNPLRSHRTIRSVCFSHTIRIQKGNPEHAINQTCRQNYSKSAVHRMNGCTVRLRLSSDIVQNVSITKKKKNEETENDEHWYKSVESTRFPINYHDAQHKASQKLSQFFGKIHFSLERVCSNSF